MLPRVPGVGGDGQLASSRTIAAEKAIKHGVTVLTGRRLGMKLHANHWIRSMLDGHDFAIVAGRREHTQRRRH